MVRPYRLQECVTEFIVWTKNQLIEWHGYLLNLLRRRHVRSFQSRHTQLTGHDWDDPIRKMDVWCVCFAKIDLEFYSGWNDNPDYFQQNKRVSSHVVNPSIHDQLISIYVTAWRSIDWFVSAWRWHGNFDGPIGTDRIIIYKVEITPVYSAIHGYYLND